MEIKISDDQLEPLIEQAVERYMQTFRPEPFVEAKEAAEHIGVKVNTLRFWASVNYKKIPVYKFGDLVKFKLSELEEWARVNKKAA